MNNSSLIAILIGIFVGQGLYELLKVWANKIKKHSLAEEIISISKNPIIQNKGFSITIEKNEEKCSNEK